METSLFKKGGKVYTRFKVSLKDFGNGSRILKRNITLIQIIHQRKVAGISILRKKEII